MTIKYAPIMTWMRYIEMNIWMISVHEQKYEDTEEEVIQKFTDLFKNELIREGSSEIDINPYKGIGYISIHLCDGEKGRLLARDNYGYLQCYWQGIYGSFGKRKLGFNRKLHGFNGEYFKYIEKEDDDYIFVSSVVNRRMDQSPNVKRLINALFMRPQPFVEQYSKKDMMFWDYSESEKKEILKECYKY